MTSDNASDRPSASRHLYSIEYDADGGALTPLQGQSIIDLYRSLSNGGIVAFVGSGTSTLLGYKNWDTLAWELLHLAEGNIAEPIDAAGKSTQRLEKAIRYVCENKDSEEALDGIDKFDRLALATEMLRQSSKDGEDYELSEKLRSIFAFPAPPTIKQSKSTLERLICGKTSVPQFLGQAEALLDKLRELDTSGYLPIDYVSGIELIEFLADRFLPVEAAGDSCRPTEKDGEITHSSVPNVDKTRLIQTPSPSIDVLGTLRKDWKITRYATLNYDHEIERMLERADFPFESITPVFRESPAATGNKIRESVPHGAPLEARSRLGEKARSVDLDHSNVAEFMLFSADSPVGVSQVLHLHGSVRDPAQMIVTDIDYNRRYFVNSAWNQVLEDSQELLYRGNAIVFIGVGMSEDVLFRAMRILSQAPEREMRPVYAFLESKGDAKDTADGIKLFQRYGIRSIFYGSRLDTALDREAGDFHHHPLVDAVVRAKKLADCSDADRQKIAEDLNPLSVELKFLESIQDFLASVKKPKAEDEVKTRTEDAPEIGADYRAEHGQLRTANAYAALKKSTSRILGDGPGSDPWSPEFDVVKLPRLMLTRWHGDIFRLILTLLHSERSHEHDPLWEDGRLESLERTVSGIRSAIHSRALLDALQAISDKSVKWRERWRDHPHTEKNTGELHFRSASSAIFYKCDERVCSHNISEPHSPQKNNRRLLDSILLDQSGGIHHQKASDLLSKHRLVVVRARSGTGKGTLAASFSEADCPGTGKRLVVSFGQSCGRDQVFDLLAHQIPRSKCDNPGEPNPRIEMIVSRADIAMTASEKRPKLAEWDAFFRSAIRHADTSLLVLCENAETVEYLRSLAKDILLLDARGDAQADGAKPVKADDTNAFVTWDLDCEDSFRKEMGVIKAYVAFDVPHESRQVLQIDRIARKCKSVWVSSFLTAVYVEIVLKSSAEYEIGAASFDDIVRRIDHALNITQDPRQRVPNLIDVAIAQIENHILRYRPTSERITKIISHAILKHLFAFGGPVEATVFARCPEFENIRRDYSETIRFRLAREIKNALKWLRGLDMVTQLTDCYSGRVRYGLHSHVCNWLATKKGLPFSVVVGREQTAITAVPIIDEEIVPLDRDDYRFIWDTIEALLKHRKSGKAPPQEQIRAAFMMLRGSMRIGTVLRSAYGDDQGTPTGRTPLEEYVRCLLNIRHAALACADMRQNSVAPLFEREWVWLFNEIGVVKLLQGHANDASALFEQAIEFESERLSRPDGFEALIYGDQNLPSFSITKLRVMMNLALAEIERGAFNRAGRILSSEKRDIEQLSHLFTRHAHLLDRRKFRSDSDSSVFRKAEHREIRILRLVLELIEARLKFLSGGAGEAIKWLEESEKKVVGEGVHGLTSLYFLIRADVEAGRKKHEKSAAMFAIARAEAEASGRSDLIFSVMLGESELQMISQIRPGATQLQQQLARIRKIKHEAQRMGMARVVVTACMLRARMYLGFGEYRSARQDLMTALTLSTSNGLNIKRASALIDMAALVGALDSEMRTEAAEIARSARFDAERMGYKLAAARAKDLELVLREQGSIGDWLFRQGAEMGSVRDEEG